MTSTSCRHRALPVKSSSITPICNVRSGEWNECTEGSTSVAGGACGTVRSAAPGGNLAVQQPSGLRNAVCLHGHGLGGG